MRIGILTFQYAYNYGALLQAYGLCKYLEGIGYDVCFINYIPPQSSSNQWFRRIKGWGREFVKQRHDMPSYMLKRFQFDRFRQHFLPLTAQCSTKEELEVISRDFDAVIAGSDQVWNGNFILNVAPHYFFDFINSENCRRISYAASFGDPQGKQTAETIEAAKTYLPQFDSISVRDEISAQIVGNLTGRQADIVLDPSLLHDFKDIAGYKQHDTQGYIASYYISKDHSKLGCTILNQVSERLQLPVIVIGNRMENHKAFISAGPLEWLRFIQESSFVCADSFHATVFAVKFRKPFITWCGNRPERARYFLRLCGLENRQVDTANPADIEKLISSPIDYDEVSDRLKSHIQHSRTFLEESLVV